MDQIMEEQMSEALVNVRALANIPKPQLYPVHGCSLDPSHYTKIHKPISSNGYEQDSISFGPIEYLYGYNTINGIVPEGLKREHATVWTCHPLAVHISCYCHLHFILIYM